MQVELTQTVYNIPDHGTAHAGAEVEVDEPLASRMVAAGQAVEVKDIKASKKGRGASQGRSAGPDENTEGAGPAESA